MNLSVDRSSLILIISCILGPLTLIFVSLRLYVRLGLQKKRLSVDDYLIIFSFLNFLGVQILTLYAIKHGTGKHLVAVLIHNPDDVPLTLKAWWIIQHFFIVATASAKVSAVIFFCSLDPPRPLRLSAIIAAWASIIALIGAESYQIFQCIPIKYFWTRFTPGATGSCLAPYKSFIIMLICNVIDIVTNIILASLPAIMLWGMNMRRKEKFGISILLGLSAITAIAALVRTCYIHDAYFHTADFTYTEFPIGLTGHLEPAVAICVVCAAHLRPLLRKMRPERRSESPDPNQVTFGRAGGRSHAKPEVTLEERIGEEVGDEESFGQINPAH